METESRYLTVQALTKYIKRKFDKDPHLSTVYLRGEISNFKRHSSGHLYFTIKDEKARILAVMFSSSAQVLKFRPENGMHVLVQGEISVYESGGQYQIYIKDMKPDGIGELYLAYEQLKKKLEQAGYFDEANKKEIPKYPKKIAVVTSPTGAAIRDIITTIERRYPLGQVLIFPALVQGEQAATSIANAIKKANEYGDIDVIIAGRGGGSIEELWAFNEEVVARAIYESHIPLISAVGHETDFTIADFIADLRAPTPTAAGEMAVPHVEELYERVLNRRLRLVKSYKNKIASEKAKLQSIMRSYVLRNPGALYNQKIEHVDRLVERLQRNTRMIIKHKQDGFSHIHNRLQRLHPSKRMIAETDRFKFLQQQLLKQMKDTVRRKEQKFVNIVTTLEALSPLKVMERGYSLVYNHEDQLVKSTKNLSKGNHITVHLRDGKAICQVEKVEEEQTENG